MEKVHENMCFHKKFLFSAYLYPHYYIIMVKGLFINDRSFLEPGDKSSAAALDVGTYLSHRQRRRRMPAGRVQWDSSPLLSEAIQDMYMLVITLPQS